MYISTNTPVAHRQLLGIGALAGIGNYYFHGVGAATDPETTDTVSATTSEILESVTTPAASAVDMIQTQVETPVVLTDTQIEQQHFGYFGAMPVSVGMQVMSIVGGVAGGLAGIIMGLKIANVTRVDTKEIILASVLAAASAFAAIFAIRTFE